MPRLARHLVIDDFLAPDLHDSLLAHALGQEAAFERSSVRKDRGNFYGDARKSLICSAKLGPLKAPLEAAIRQALPAILEGIGLAPFEPARIELEISAHRNGDYFLPHIDTFHGGERDGIETDRVVTAVYYFHAQPKAFTGGEFRIHPFGADGGDPVDIEPKNNRLLALPAFALHEVRPIASDSDDFRSSRFAVNAWVHRARRAG